MDLLKRMIEGYDEQKAIEALTTKDHWQDVIRAEQNKLVMQEEMDGIETHFDVPCAIVYIGPIKGVIPVYEFGIDKDEYVQNRDDIKDEKKLSNSYQFLRGMTGQKIAFVVKGHDKKGNLFMASRKEALQFMRKRSEDEMKPGVKTLAVVRKVFPNRVIADIGGISAILDAPEYQHGWTEDMQDHIQAGDHILVQILKMDTQKGKTTAVLSRKALIPDPWESLVLTERSEYGCEITGVQQSGCYFRLKTPNGYVDGFLTHPKHEVLNRGDKALVRIISIDKDKHRIFGRYLRPLKVS